MDFLLLVSSQYQTRSLTLDDACAHCVDRIHLQVDGGKLVRAHPEEAVVYRART